MEDLNEFLEHKKSAIVLNEEDEKMYNRIIRKLNFEHKSAIPREKSNRLIMYAIKEKFNIDEISYKYIDIERAEDYQLEVIDNPFKQNILVKLKRRVNNGR